jgi:hypothetical protein
MSKKKILWAKPFTNKWVKNKDTKKLNGLIEKWAKNSMG